MGVKAYAAMGPKQKLEPYEYEPGPLAPHEVEVKVTHCGICHSDLAMIDNDFGFSAYPLVPGHEVIGTVAAVGSEVEDLAVGTRVGVGWQCSSCGHCEWCVRARQNFCAQNAGTIVHHHGGWASSVRCKAEFAIPIPDALDSSVAGPLMCAGTTVFTPMKSFGVSPLMRTAVAGVGGLGHLAVQYLAAFGCDVTAISSTHSKDEETRKLGANHFIATRGTDELAKAANSFDFIISTVSSGVDWQPYIQALRPGGRIVFVGLPVEPVPVGIFSILAEKSVSGGMSGSPVDTADMLAFSARHGIKPMCEFFDMKDVNRAVQHVRDGKARFRAVLVA